MRKIIVMVISWIALTSPLLWAQDREIVIENRTPYPLELYEYSLRTERSGGGTSLMTSLAQEMNDLSGEINDYLKTWDHIYDLIKSQEGREIITERETIGESCVISSNDIWDMIKKARSEIFLNKEAVGILADTFAKREAGAKELTDLMGLKIMFQPLRRLVIEPGEEALEMISGNELTLLWEQPDTGSLVLTSFVIEKNDSKVTFLYDETKTSLRIVKDVGN